MKIMKNKLAKLINVKSIVTLVLVFVFSYLSVTGKVSPADFQTVFLMIITFYFTRRTDNNENEMPIDKEVE